MLELSHDAEGSSFSSRSPWHFSATADSAPNQFLEENEGLMGPLSPIVFPTLSNTGNTAFVLV